LTDAETRVALRRAFHSRLRWLWPLLAAPWLRQTLRFATWGLLLAWFAFASLVLALRYVVLPGIGNYHVQVEQALTQAVGQPVRVGRIEARWTGLNPDLIFADVVIADRQGTPAFSLNQVEAVFSWQSLWRRQLTLNLLAFESPVLHVRRSTDGRITVAGIATEGESDPAFAEWVLAQKRIRIRNATIVWEDRLRQAPPLILEDLQFALDNKGRRHRFGLSAAPPADLAARIEVRGEFNGALDEALEELAGRIFVQLDYADLAGWRAWVDYPIHLPQGRGALRLWGDLQEGQSALTADLALEEVRIRFGRKLPELDLESLRGRIEGRYRVGDWALTGKKVELLTRDSIRVAPTDFHAEWREAAASGQTKGSATASFLDLAVLGRLAAHLPLDSHSRELLVRHAPQGRISELRASWGGTGEKLASYALRANFSDLGIRPGGYFPGSTGLSGLVQLDERGGEISLDSKASSLSLPAVFPEPETALDLLRGRATWKIAGEVIDLKLERLQFEGPHAAGTASGSYRHTGAGPGVIDLVASISRADGRAVWRYLPYAVSADVRDWVRTGIVEGRAHDAKLVLKGNLADFPFRDEAKGSFLITAKATGAKVDFADGWPLIEQIDADLSFGAGMRVVASKGRILGASLSNVVVEIPDFESTDEMLNIRGEASGPTAEFLRFIDQSPVSGMINHFTRGMKAVGNGKLDLALDLPLRRLPDTRLRAEYRFANNQLQLIDGLAPLTQVNGLLSLTENAITAREISGQIFGGPLKVQIRDRGDRVAVQAAGTAQISELGKHFSLPAYERLAGSAAWKSDISIYQGNADFVVESPLVGVSSRLPEPLAKNADTALPLRLERTALDAGREQYRLTLGNMAKGIFIKRDATLEQAAVTLGDGDARLAERGIALRIAVPRLDADAWKEVITQAGSGNGTNTPGIDMVSVQTPLLHLFGRDFTEVDTVVRPRNDGWQITLNTREAAGDLFWRNTGEGWLEGRLQRLSVHRPAGESISDTSELINTLPGLNLTVDDFRFSDNQLGQLELKARNDKGAWTLDTLNLSNPDGSLKGKALWRNTGRHQTRLDFELTAVDIGRLLARLGYVDAVRRGSARLTGDLRWEGPLTRIHHPSLTGQMAVVAENGQFNQLEPGAGRLLGLLSLQSLPRRLTLDFRDIFSEGLAFDSIEGATTVTAGVMRTSGPLRINSPAAQIEIQGEANLKDETQNLQVLVRPRVGSLAAIGAATLINPIAGAAALVASTVLQNPIGRLFSYRYQVTGSWSDPKVEKVGQFVEEPPIDAAEGGRQ